MTTIVLPGQRPPGRRGFEIVLSSAATNGTAALVEAHVDAAVAGPPLHVHTGSEETYFVVSGALIMVVDGEVVELGPSGLAHISRGTTHTWATPVGTGAHFVTLHTPGGYEQYHPTALRAEQELARPLEQVDLFELAQRFDWALAGAQPLRLTPNGVLVQASRADDEAAAAAAAVDVAAFAEANGRSG
jgi:mannose-6-phosphate isomerase-like protein (cupin superfamily)